MIIRPYLFTTSTALLVACGMSASGCGVSTETTITGDESTAPAQTAEVELVPEMTEEETAIAATLEKLSPSDLVLARAQKICPVSMEPLGTMGVPPKMEVDGRIVFTCCKGCNSVVQKNPEKYLARLDAELEPLDAAPKSTEEEPSADTE